MSKLIFCIRSEEGSYDFFIYSDLYLMVFDFYLYIDEVVWNKG